MNPSQRLLSALGAVAMLACSSAASATLFTITDASFARGSGYGEDVDENGGTLLDVRFTTAGTFNTQNFALNAVNQSFTFNFGTIDLEETNSHSGIVDSETDGLDVAARLTFTAPFGSLIQLLITGVATTGSVSDAAIDYVLDWNPVQVAFGNGGLIEISLSDMSFTGIETLTQTATLTLLRTSESPPTPTIPEPATLALLGLGIGCVAITRRRRSACSTTARFNDSVTNPAPAQLS